MSRYFVDAGHLIALINPKDQWHRRSIEIDLKISNSDLVTTEEVLTELLNFYCESGEYMRSLAAKLARETLLNIRVTVVSSIETSFIEALDLYEARPDKGYSLTDCISMNVCKASGVSEILTNDDHFRQEGFVLLL
jgi:predicted nucleic acid-binding protein